MFKGIALGVIVLGCCIANACFAQNLYNPDTFKAYAADHKATLVGDSLSILVYENSEARSNSDVDEGRSTSAGVNLVSTNDNRFGDLDFGINGQENKDIQRQGRLRAQITATVEEIDDAGRLKVVGIQQISVNEEVQVISISGWVRPTDISPNNTVLSTRLSDALIEYRGDDLDGLDGQGGIIRRVGDIIMWVPNKALDLTAWLLGVL